MIFKINKHDVKLYITLLSLSRNILFYKEIGLPDNFETRIYLMFFHFSLLMIVFKSRGVKFEQKNYDDFFHSIENDLREKGLGDVSVNKKMKELNKILYDILLKILTNNTNIKLAKINFQLVSKYFPSINDQKSKKYKNFEQYFLNFLNFCFDQSSDNMIEVIKNFKY